MGYLLYLCILIINKRKPTRTKITIPTDLAIILNSYINHNDMIKNDYYLEGA